MTGPSRSSYLRPAVLGAAVVLALLLAAPSRIPDALAQAAAPSSTPESVPPAAAPTPPATPAPAKPAAKKEHGIRATIDLDLDGDKEAAKGASDKGDAAAKADSGATHGIVVENGGKRVRVVGIDGADREYDSIAQFAKNEPTASMVVLIVAIIFLSPVLLVAVIVAYRIKKARLANEAMLRLAERGVVPPTEAMQAIASGQSLPRPIDAAPGTSNLTEQAKQLGRRAAVSDLRKGVVLAAVGLGITAGTGAEGAPSSIGLIVLFLGLGYIGLWWFETRQIERSNTGSAGPQA